MTFTAGTKLGPYEILSPLGAGGMGEVYRARDTRLDRIVAVKVLPEELARDPGALERFEREAKAVAALSHPNILAIHDFGTSGGAAYAVTELLDGETLRDRLRDSAVPLRKAIDYAQQIARGLAAAHERGIVHRDVKPENVFLTRDGLVKILDFGIARQVPLPAGSGGAEALSTRDGTEPGLVLGTAGYMSPEQVRGKPVDPRSDLFSLGSVLYEMVTGRRAFQRESPIETMMSILQEDPPSVVRSGRDLPPELDEVLGHCLEKNPDERFQSARDLAFALRVLERDAGSRTPSGGAAAVAETASVRTGAVSLPSIAVLPFRNVSADPENEYFSDGMTEEIIDALTKIESLRVAARTSSFAFKGKDEDVRRIGERLGVRTVLEGSVRRAGDKIRISAQLVDTSNGYHVWSEHFDRDMRDVFAVQEEIARAIAAALRIRLLPANEASLVTPGTVDVEAYNRYLKGRFHFNRRDPRKAIEMFEAAIARDPRYAAAYTGLADSYGIFGFYGGIPTREAFSRARAAADRARELQPDSSEVHVSLGIVEHYFGWDFEKEERELKRAIALSPGSADAYTWLALLYGLSGRVDDALAKAAEAVRLEPLSPNVRTNRGWPLYVARRFEEANAEYRAALQLDPHAMYPAWASGMAYQCAGEHAEAIAAYERCVAVTERRLSWPIALLGGAYAAAGRRDEAREVLRELEEIARREYLPPLHLAYVYTPLGERDRSLDLLEKACDERNALCWWIRYNPLFDPLRSDPRFEEILGSISPA
jgi:eukaryotic-like serine/threonine-protein kinase